MKTYITYPRKSKILKKIEVIRHQELRKLLYRCTYEQQKMFNQMYGAVENIADDKIEWALIQCKNTLHKMGFIEEGACIYCENGLLRINIQNCSCHIDPPCSGCENANLKCDECFSEFNIKKEYKEPTTAERDEVS